MTGRPDPAYRRPRVPIFVVSGARRRVAVITATAFLVVCSDKITRFLHNIMNI